ncbi:hypothetical protein [Neobacillus cucumis]|nr:hypothetical protein [Neobacillus cucumis]
MIKMDENPMAEIINAAITGAIACVTVLPKNCKFLRKTQRDFYQE